MVPNKVPNKNVVKTSNEATNHFILINGIFEYKIVIYATRAKSKAFLKWD